MLYAAGAACFLGGKIFYFEVGRPAVTVQTEQISLFFFMQCLERIRMRGKCVKTNIFI